MSKLDFEKLHFFDPQNFTKPDGVSKVPVGIRISGMDHSKQHQKLWGLKLELIYFMILGQRYRESKGVWLTDRRNPP